MKKNEDPSGELPPVWTDATDDLPEETPPAPPVVKGPDA